MQAALTDVPLNPGRVQGFTNFRFASSNLSAVRGILQQHIVTKNNRLHAALKEQVSNDRIFV
jgi:polyisoprenoid-binding protein YceI